MRIEITKDCFCEHYLHEITFYPRNGLIERKFSKGDQLDVEKTWNNCYGEYYRCSDEISQWGYVDINLTNAKII